MDNIDYDKYKLYKKKGMHVLLYPNQIRLGLTKGCNRSCDFCCLPKEKRNLKEPDYISFKEFKNEWVPSLPIEAKNYSIAQDGEPLYNKDIVEIVEFLRNQNKKRHIGITSNGNYLLKEPKILLELYKAGLNTIQINVYKDKKIITAIKNIGTELKKLNVKAEYTLSGNKIFVSNYKEKNLYIIKEHFKQKELTRPLHTCGGNLPVNKKYEHLYNNLPLYRQCTYPLKHLSITSDGNIGICCADMLHTVKLGNIKTHNVKELWLGKELQAVRFILKSKRRDLILPCSLCTVRTFRDGLYPYYQKEMDINEAKEIVDRITIPPTKNQLKALERIKNGN